MNAKTLIIAAAALLLANLSLAGESLPLKSVNKANEIIDAAIEAHGGAEALGQLETLAQKAEAVVVCDAAPRTDVDGWKKRVAEGAALAFSNGPDQTKGCIKEVLRQLAREKRPE